jgi:hypothetical protein
MKALSNLHRLVAVALLASVSLAALAPAAQAGHGHGGPPKYRKGDYRQVDYRPSYGRGGYYGSRRVVEVRHVYRGGGGGSTLAGFLGGLAAGVILSNAQQAHANRDNCPPPRDVYRDDGYRDDGYRDDGYRSSRGDYRGCEYEDPYSHERYVSLDVYLDHTRHCDHPRVVRVIDLRDGDCVRVIHYDHGQWGDWRGDSDWDD